MVDADTLTEALTDPLDVTVGWVVRNGDASVRLFNCITFNQAVAAMTVRQYLSDPSEARRLLLGTPNLGRKTATELADLIGTIAALPYIANIEKPSPAKSVVPRATTAFRILFGLLVPVPFPSALMNVDISARLKNGLIQFEAAQAIQGRWEADVPNLGVVVAKWPEIRPKLLRQANLGRKTVAELEEIIETIVTNIVAMTSDVTEDSFIVSIESLTEKNLDPDLIDTLIKIGDRGDELESNPDIPDILRLLHGADPNVNLPPQQHVANVISALPRKEQDVIVRRFGMQGHSVETLEEVAGQFHVTRERVRQVESKALRRLRIGANVRAFNRLLIAEQNNVWRALTGDTDLLTPSDIQDGRSAIPPDFLLAIEVVHGRIVDWAASVGQVALGGWFTGSDEPKAIQRSISRLIDWARDAPGPIPFSAATAAIGVPERHLAIALKLRSEIWAFEDYLCPGHLGSQAKRTCRLHKLSLETGQLQPFDVTTIHRKYASAFPEDNSLPRVISLQLQRAPHLFFRMFDGIWISITSDPSIDCVWPTEIIPFERTDTVGANEFEGGSIGAWLYETLARTGPMRLVDLRSQAEADLPQKISQSSVGAVLQSNADFVRVAPGVYSLQRDVASLLDVFTPIPAPLLSSSQCRYYSMSRAAGDPIGLYPAWSTHFEAALCGWAEGNAAADDVYRSLLAVSEPMNWPVGVGDRLAWADRRRNYGSLRTPRLPPPEVLQRPSPADFLAASIYLRMTGSIAWTTVNRTAQRRLDSQKAASTLALLVAFGMAAPVDHWQQRHTALPLVTSVTSKIIADLARTGSVSWDQGALAALQAAPMHHELGYLDVNQVMEMLAAGDDGDAAASVANSGGLGDLDSIFGSDDWGSGFASDTK
jgi:hypothetical protein